MKRGFVPSPVWVALALCSFPWLSAEAGYVTMVDNGPSTNRVDIVFLGDGYTASQIDTVYVSHVQSLLNYFFNQTQDPFPRYRNFFNVHRVNVISNESGADVPPLGIARDTALDASYYWDGTTDRLLYVNSSKANAALSSGLAGAGFTAEMRPVTVNDTRYGGGGGWYAVYAGGNSGATEIALHELGHSFAGLADEYDYGGSTTYTGPEPSQANITTSSSGDKWARWLGYVDPDHSTIGAIGAYEGANYSRYGIYRPSANSKMRSLNRPFDAVSREDIILDIYRYVNPLDAWSDNAQTLVNPESLWVDVVDPNVIKTEWIVNGVVVPGVTGPTFNPMAALGPGAYTITAHAFDDTAWVRLSTSELEQRVSWSVAIQAAVPEPASLGLAVIGLVGLVSSYLSNLFFDGRPRKRKTH
jgi:hypothetical protein